MGGLKPSEILSRAADLIEPEGAWTQIVMARDTIGRSVPPLSDRAVCWCALGAATKVNGSPVGTVAATDHLRKLVDTAVGRFNDASTQSEVVAALRKASTLALEAGE